VHCLLRIDICSDGQWKEIVSQGEKRPIAAAVIEQAAASKLTDETSCTLKAAAVAKCNDRIATTKLLAGIVAEHALSRHCFADGRSGCRSQVSIPRTFPSRALLRRSASCADGLGRRYASVVRLIISPEPLVPVDRRTKAVDKRSSGVKSKQYLSPCTVEDA